MTDAPIPPGVVDVGGEPYLRDAKDKLVPLENVKAADRLQDQMVRELLAEAEALQDLLRAFKAKAFETGAAMQAVLDADYGVKIGGEKGNVTFQTFDGRLRMQIAVADIISFGPELKSAKALIDECLTEWGKGGHPVLRQLVQNAFDVDKEGQLNRGAIFQLLRAECDDQRWKRAMDAIRDSIRVSGSRAYVRFHKRRPGREAKWENVSLDIATA